MVLMEELMLVLGLSMDGFAASVCLGMELGRKKYPPIILLISGCHVMMLLVGYALGMGLKELWTEIFPCITGGILTLLGLRMLRASGQEDGARTGGGILSIAALALATSVDAMTVGVAFALMGTPAWRAGLLTALVMGTLSVIGASLGGRFGKRRRFAARITGGAILLLLGLRSLLEALGLI